MRSARLIAVLALAFAAAAHADTDSSLGKSPDWGGDAPTTNAMPHAVLNDAPNEPYMPYVESSDGYLPPPPKPFVTLANATAFIQKQRRLQGHGLPATFYVPRGTDAGNSLRQLLITEGVGLYDTALAVITLVDAGDLKSAGEILDIYTTGAYGSDTGVPMELCALPNRDNGGAFSNFDVGTYYFFDFTNVYGDWQRWRNRWVFWNAHTGPNAWMVNAMIRYITAARAAGRSERTLEPYLNTVKSVGAAFLRLQDPRAQGGVRYGPEAQFVENRTVPPYDQVNTENNLSVYVAFRMIYEQTGDPIYQAAAERVLNWFRNAEVWTDKGERRHGLFDPATATLAMGAEYHHGRWVLQNEHPTDSAGTWAISSLGPGKIDDVWGTGSAYTMWRTIRQRAGRTADFKWARATGTLAGLDYTDAFPESESLISPEWTAGGLFALRQLRQYYGTGAGQGLLTAEQLHSLETDARTMSAYIRDHSTPYALGPGFDGKRQGQIGFGWVAPPPDVQAMASIYVALYFEGKADPSGWWRQR